MAKLGDRVKETSTTTGTGSLTLLGAVAQFSSFATSYGAVSVLVPYAIAGQTGTEWDTGLGYFNGTTTLTRQTVLRSSNADALVNLSAGTKDVFVTGVAEDLQAGSIGVSLALAAGLAMP